MRNYFGVNEREGVIVLKVTKDSPAEGSGLAEGDLILTFDKQSITTSKDLVRMVAYSEVGKDVVFTILRAGKEISIKVTIGKAPDEDLEAQRTQKPVFAESDFYFRGMMVDDISADYQKQFNLRQSQGVVIVDIEDESLAGKSGLRAGDTILKVENKNVGNKKEFQAIASLSKGNCLLKTTRGFFVIRVE